jgi:CheY-like chemotaxis protein
MFVSERDKRKKVLVVEDNSDDVELLQIAARAAPDAVSFHIVGDAEQGQAYLKGEGQYADRKAHPFPDLILLDLGLPGMNGFDLLAWIRAHPEFNALTVFVWTDSGDRGTLDRAAKAGANRFVPKSVAFVRGGLAGLVRAISEAIPKPAEKDGLSAKNSRPAGLAAGTRSNTPVTR